MAQTRRNIDIIQAWYDNPGPDFLTDDADFKLADGFIADGHYHGKAEIFGTWWPKLMAQVTEWRGVPDQLFDAGDVIVGIGHYVGVAKATGRSFKVPFARLWFMRDGKIARVHHNANTLMLYRARTEPGEPIVPSV